MNKASCLSLLCNAVLVWNTVQMSRIIEQLRATGVTITDEEVALISPLAYAHVIPNGSDIHVMFALRCSSRQIVMAYEELYGTDMVGQLLGKR